LGLCAERHFWIAMPAEAAIAAMADGGLERARCTEAAKF
jgi:hypothetical protein